MIETLILAIGLVLIVEGLVIVLAPRFLEDLLRLLVDMPIETRRLLGLAGLAAGVFLAWISQSIGG